MNKHEMAILYDRYREYEDKEAFTKLYMYCVPYILNNIQKWVNYDLSVAEDIAHDCFLELIDKKLKFDKTKGVALHSFLYSCSVKKAIDKNKNLSKSVDLTALINTPDESLNTEAKLLKEELIACLKSELIYLSEDYNEIILSLLETESIVETAKQLGDNESTVRTRIRRAIDLLRISLMKMGFNKFFLLLFIYVIRIK